MQIMILFIIRIQIVLLVQIVIRITTTAIAIIKLITRINGGGGGRGGPGGTVAAVAAAVVIMRTTVLHDSVHSYSLYVWNEPIRRHGVANVRLRWSAVESELRLGVGAARRCLIQGTKFRHLYLDPKSMLKKWPETSNLAQKAIISHTFGSHFQPARWKNRRGRREA